MTFNDFIKGLSFTCSTGEKKKMRLAWAKSAEKHKPRWVPVTERLPIKSGWFPVISTYQMSTQKWTKDYFDGRNFSSDVTHFFELPETPA